MNPQRFFPGPKRGGCPSDPEANDDFYTLNNFMEYSLGLNPTFDDAEGVFTFTVDGSGTAQYRFFAAVSNMNFTVEYSHRFADVDSL